MIKLNLFSCLFTYHVIMLFRIVQARLHALLISVIEWMSGSFMPLTLGRKWVGTQRTGGSGGHITVLELVQNRFNLRLYR